MDFILNGIFFGKNIKLCDLLKSEAELYKQECGFTEREKKIFDDSRRGFLITKIALKNHYSTATINRILAKITQKIKAYRERSFIYGRQDEPRRN